MYRLARLALPTLLACALLLLSVPAFAERNWEVERGQVTLSLDDAHLANFGLAVVSPRVTGEAEPPAELGLDGSLYSFEVADLPGLRFRTDHGVFAGFESRSVVQLPVRGGLVFRTRSPRTGEALAPVYLFDFTFEIDPAAGQDLVRILSGDPNLPVPLEVKNTGLAIEHDRGELAIRYGDLVISEAWAQQLGEPLLAGQWIGVFDLRLSATTNDPRPALPPRDQMSLGTVMDAEISEVYGLTQAGRTGTYPNGLNGLSAATTSCNPGDVDFPWFGPMSDQHPFIGLAMYRLDAAGTLEQIGINWIKHGFFSVNGNDCLYGCTGPPANWLYVGCSDTYSSGNNASRTYLGPRREVNPHLGAWEPCGSFFDGTPSDCQRSYNGNEPNGVNHRLEVRDQDLLTPGASYYFEGAYFFAGDENSSNDYGWRGVIPNWIGSSWQFDDGSGQADIDGPVLRTWGDEQAKSNPSGDGTIWIAVKTTDLGGGQWHYEYAVFNESADRGVGSFSIPITGVNVSNVGFRDIDQDGGNDWTSSTSADFVTWSTEDYATNPDANYLGYQMLYNFRFDADQPPLASNVVVGLFKPGVGTQLMPALRGPAPDPTSTRLIVEGAGAFSLESVEPNPFAERTQVRFSLDRERDVRLSVLDVTGRTVQVLIEGSAPAGASTLTWNGRDSNGARVTSGVYFFRLESGTEVRTLKGTFLR